MMYSEFIARTTYDESYITYEDYSQYIEPVYMAGDEDKTTFCKRFYKLHRERVGNITSMLIAAKSIQELEAFIDGDGDVMDDVKEIERTLKLAFLKTWHKNGVVLPLKYPKAI